MILTSNTKVQESPVWNIVKDWNNEDKVQLITLLSISLAKPFGVDETTEEKTKCMSDKFAGCWKGNDGADDFLNCFSGDWENDKSTAEVVASYRDNSFSANDKNLVW